MNTPDLAQRLIHPRKFAAPNRWDLVAFPLIFAVFVLLAIAAKGTFAPLQATEATPISLDPAVLPGYALRTVLRMLAALAASLLFTLTYGTLAAKSKRAEIILLPVLDILQSVPILGYISFTVLFFMNLFPGSTLGAELASIFAVFTSQAWNMAFSFYQSLRTIPHDLDEASRAFRFSTCATTTNLASHRPSTLASRPTTTPAPSSSSPSSAQISASRSTASLPSASSSHLSSLLTPPSPSALPSNSGSSGGVALAKTILDGGGLRGKTE